MPKKQGARRDRGRHSGDASPSGERDNDVDEESPIAAYNPTSLQCVRVDEEDAGQHSAEPASDLLQSGLEQIQKHHVADAGARTEEVAPRRKAKGGKGKQQPKGPAGRSDDEDADSAGAPEEYGDADFDGFDRRNERAQFKKDKRKTKGVKPDSAVPTDIAPPRPPRSPAAEVLPPKLERLDDWRLLIHKGFVPNMRAEGLVFATRELTQLLLEEMKNGGGQMQPALRQVANVAGLPGIVGRSTGMPDIHCGYGFAIGNVCAVDCDDPEAVVSPGGVGFDINCGVRLLRTNLDEAEVVGRRERLADALFNNIPVGAGSGRGMDVTTAEISQMMAEGMGYLLDRGCPLVWPEDKEHCEEAGCLGWANAGKVSGRAVARGVSQVGTMGAGNHYCEVQAVDEIFDPEAAAVMGIHHVGQVCIMIHSGSRGLGHQVCTDYLMQLDKSMKESKMPLNDRQLACAKINSPEGQNYLAAMAAAANFAFCNRSMMAAQVRKAFEDVFRSSAKELDMYQIYDVCHNIAKFEEHTVDGVLKKVLVHRKGATRSFPPHHPAVPEKYREIGQPVIIGGSMGTCSYVLTGAPGSMAEAFGSTCHGAGREMSRSAALKAFTSKSVKAAMEQKGIYVRAGDSRLLAEEAGGAYKDVTQVVQTCHAAGISKLCFRLRPLVVIKG